MMSSASVDERHGTFFREISTTIGPNDRLYNKTTTKGHDDEDENNKQADYWHFVAFAFLGAPMAVWDVCFAHRWLLLLLLQRPKAQGEEAARSSNK